MSTFPGRAFRYFWQHISPQLRSRMLPVVLEYAADSDKFRAGIPTMRGLFENLRNAGFHPGAIVDIGANLGNWARMIRAVFPQPAIAMFDGNPRHEPALAGTVREIGHASYAIAVLGPEPKQQVPFFLAGPGSGVLQELTTFPREEARLAMFPLDQLIGESAIGAELPQRLLMKLDVQGYELEVLRGAAATLARAEVVVLEVSLLPYNEGGADFMEVMTFMDASGFAAYDFSGQFRRESDWALCQTDVVFVRRESELRGARKFWRTEP